MSTQDSTHAAVAALRLYEAAHENLFSQCCSNPIKNAWGKEVDLSKLNIAHEAAGRALNAAPALETPAAPAADLALIIAALEHGQPQMAHYAEPCERHAKALAAARRMAAAPQATAAPVDEQSARDSICAWSVWWTHNKAKFTTPRQAAIAAWNHANERALRAMAAPAAPAVDAWLQPADMAALQRFHETAEDDESYDIGKEAVARLCAFGCLQSHSFGRYSTTDFGDYLLDTWAGARTLPFTTAAERRDRAAQAKEGGAR